MNLLCLLEDFRGQGFGTELVRFWEGTKWEKAGYGLVMTSTASNPSCAQHFYYRLGYDGHRRLLPAEGEPYELLLARKL